MSLRIHFGKNAVLQNSAHQHALTTELIRKTIHISSAVTVLLAQRWYTQTIAAIIGMSVLYGISEWLLMHHYHMFCIAALTRLAARERDKGRVVYGPLTLAVGVVLALVLYPLHTAKIAVYALAFGDGVASLIGKKFGKTPLRFTRDKTVVGSAACFTVVACTSFVVSGSVWKSGLLALLTTVIEMLPLKDFDNLFIPLIVGFAALVLRA